ncbi:MAG TPA: phenylalanine--tRNA ligase beta subunit-related protein [Micromonosporaceae bacterium]|jgi:phenylalanyl-tRNA synthetase beta chain
MRVSLDWVADYVDLPPVAPRDLAHALTLKTVEVEDVLVLDGDAVLEIDNKSLTNRPDLWGHYGIARELAVIFDVPLRPLPRPRRPGPVQTVVGRLDPEICQRFAALTLDLGEGEAVSPDWLRDRLVRVGQGGVNLAVDLTTYVMLAVGQPMHAYDAGQLAGPLSAVRAGSVQPLLLLDGATVQVMPRTPVIADEDGPVALAGIMGGAASAIGPGTRRIVVEVATFRATPVRRAPRRSSACVRRRPPGSRRPSTRSASTPRSTSSSTCSASWHPGPQWTGCRTSRWSPPGPRG